MRKFSSLLYGIVPIMFFLASACLGGCKPSDINKLQSSVHELGARASEDPDLIQLESLTNQRVTGDYSVPLRAQIISYAIDRSATPEWALVDWGCFPAGGEIAALKGKDATWRLRFQRIGIYTKRQLEEAGMPRTVADYLKANMHQYDHRTVRMQDCRR